MSNIINATDASFEADVLQADVPVLVDFWHLGAVLVKRLPLF